MKTTENLLSLRNSVVSIALNARKNITGDALGRLNMLVLHATFAVTNSEIENNTYALRDFLVGILHDEIRNKVYTYVTDEFGGDYSDTPAKEFLLTLGVIVPTDYGTCFADGENSPNEDFLKEIANYSCEVTSNLMEWCI